MQAVNNRHGSHQERDFDPRTKAWMKTHTVGDLKNLAREMESKGENASELLDIIQTLEGIEAAQTSRMGDD